MYTNPPTCTGHWQIFVTLHKLHNLLWQNKQHPLIRLCPLMLLKNHKQKKVISSESATCNEDVVENLKIRKTFDILGRYV